MPPQSNKRLLDDGIMLLSSEAIAGQMHLFSFPFIDHRTYGRSFFFRLLILRAVLSRGCFLYLFIITFLVFLFSKVYVHTQCTNIMVSYQAYISNHHGKDEDECKCKL